MSGIAPRFLTNQTRNCSHKVTIMAKQPCVLAVRNQRIQRRNERKEYLARQRKQQPEDATMVMSLQANKRRTKERTQELLLQEQGGKEVENDDDHESFEDDAHDNEDNGQDTDDDEDDEGKTTPHFDMSAPILITR